MGRVSFSGSMRVAGRFEGGVSSPGSVVITEGGACVSNLSGLSVVVIDGSHVGDIIDVGHVAIGKGATVVGNVSTMTLAIAPGAKVKGTVQVNPDPPPEAARPAPRGGDGAVADVVPPPPRVKASMVNVHADANRSNAGAAFDPWKVARETDRILKGTTAAGPLRQKVVIED